MKIKHHSVFIGAYILIVLAGVVWHAGGVSAEDTIKLKVNSHTTSQAVMDNMQPGDEMSSEYTVINDGNERFTYYVDFKYQSGSKELFEVLQMTLEKEGVTLYSGAMSAAEGRVAIGSLPGGGQEKIRMDVIFPPEAGNEFQGKSASVAFEFSASAVPDPTAGPSATPTATATPEASASPTATASSTPEASATPTATASSTPEASATPTATASSTPEASASPTATASSTPEASATPTATASSTPEASATPTATASSTPGASATPTATATVVPTSSPVTTPVQTAPPATASPAATEVTLTDEPVPMGAGGDEPSPDPGSAGSVDAGATATPEPEIVLEDDELPLAAPEDDSELPDTAGPWYNLIAVSLIVAALSILALRKLRTKK
ncbi:hypothetical protein [Paenibacillus tengchongensis]|uniref:hypothetical protein n=1 Tax=Paenibacillus tengchongensis TaxID=2608684 RepID=UPI00124E7898|nr:hypothetical protein [Paenibacillus tengchongensis]